MLKQSFWERSWRILKVSKFFPFFCVFCKFRPPRVHWAKIFAEKLHRSMLKTCLNTFGNVFRHFEKLNVFQFFEVFPSVDPTGCTGHFFPRKLPENKFKTCVETFKFIFGHFWEFNFFSTFSSKFYKIRSPGCTGQEIFGKNYLTQVWTLLETFFGIWKFWNLFDSCGFFWVSRVHWAELFSVEIIKQNMLKQCFWERFWRNLKVSQFFHFFVFFPSFDHPGCTGQEKIEKITSSKFGHFLKRFSGFWNFEIFDLCGFFLSLQGSLGTAFSVEKINQNILRQCFWESFRTFLKISKFFFFLKFFPSLDPPGCTGDFFSKKNYLKTGSDNVWTILGTALDTLEILKFSIFSNLSLTRPSRVH